MLIHPRQTVQNPRFGMNFADFFKNSFAFPEIRDIFTPFKQEQPILRGGAVVARQAHNLKAVGSIPTPATNELPGLANRKSLFLYSFR